MVAASASTVLGAPPDERGRRVGVDGVAMGGNVAKAVNDPPSDTPAPLSCSPILASTDAINKGDQARQAMSSARLLVSSRHDVVTTKGRLLDLFT
eukprot:m.383107 g.383107  ORF g.383107 m.383107 type:complete len:95 (-) comp20045_c7_seq66:4594-4878(-)